MQRRPRMIPFALAATILLAGAGCADPPGEAERSAPADADTLPAAQEGNVARAALPGLFNIMIGLQADMAAISRGIWLADFDSVAAGARRVADHPRVPSAELQVIRRALGDEVVRFQELDTRVHDLAVELAEHAAAADTAAVDTAAVLEADAALRRGCVACHQEFRERLREGIRASTEDRPAADSAEGQER